MAQLPNWTRNTDYQGIEDHGFDMNLIEEGSFKSSAEIGDLVDFIESHGEKGANDRIVGFITGFKERARYDAFIWVKSYRIDDDDSEKKDGELDWRDVVCYRILEKNPNFPCFPEK
ncbi:hypothetical protein FJZ18_00830 [Candidatus Pacearchaeota archaeon]|nr:hypothetical protein [Candidatus Pacearchaeota archaeon]